ncbi:nucleotide exchange factor GrpE [Rhizobium glycinendophyticum]|uniref:Protein GrpE n=1 Tax=Rhizobium glycinendophyticum TaxID=2589807 RepID=A0A504UFQ1_9HYPH|nr:nucleotide exchange factor GrpE [Rhizobium glycinendophyticum]TPP09615.1 nucleotide exchange factor GrpE [Rhizobium glycinendophyticum]
MTEETNKNGPDADAAEAYATEAQEDQANAEATTDAEGGAAEALDALKAENADLRDRFLRLAADMDNLRRRTEREIKDAKSYAMTGFARDMLSVSDNLRRAIESLPEDARAGADAAVTALIEGVEMTERGMLATMERHGIRKIEPVGQKFDPNFHQAMFEVPNPDVANNTVVQVVQAGYAIGERVLRPAMVGVAKGGPKAEAAAEDAAKA